MEEIIYKECNNIELSRSEQLQLKMWLSESPRNRRVYAQMKLVLLNPDEQKREKLKQDVWVELSAKLKPEVSDTPSTTRRYTNYWTKVAAAFIFIIGLAYVAYRVQTQNVVQETIVESQLIEKVSLPGQKITTMLPDGTIVKLNSGSKILTPDKFTADTREVTLYGEAFFEVTRDERKPFIIKTKDIQIEVLGTSFNVRSYTSEAHSTVAVATGKVAVSDESKREQLVPGEKVFYTSDTKTMEKETFEWEEQLGWKDNILMFQGENFTEIKDILARWYGIEINMENQNIDINKRFSGRYKDPSLPLVLEGLSYVYDFSYEIENKIVTLK